MSIREWCKEYLGITVEKNQPKIDSNFYCGEAMELHEFLDEQKIPRFSGKGKDCYILPLIDRVLLFAIEKERHL